MCKRKSNISYLTCSSSGDNSPPKSSSSDQSLKVVVCFADNCKYCTFQGKDTGSALKLFLTFLFDCCSLGSNSIESLTSSLLRCKLNPTVESFLCNFNIRKMTFRQWQFSWQHKSYINQILQESILSVIGKFK